ncbi:unnamed protein product [Coffea canephora]|uniref:DH200=94 genomic scaffold, scaffold_1800 n=1 Tax=Coffea canephora TaxID=49390 RepID=A0A068VJ24_COFCA|nr:unnamed protein product [Coffea canephora]
MRHYFFLFQVQNCNTIFEKSTVFLIPSPLFLSCFFGTIHFFIFIFVGAHISGDDSFQKYL